MFIMEQQIEIAFQCGTNEYLQVEKELLDKYSGCLARFLHTPCMDACTTRFIVKVVEEGLVIVQ